jgi:hypothetical protein
MYEQAEDPTPTRQRPDPPPLLGRDTGGDELLQLTSVSDHSEGPISGIRDLSRKIDDPLKNHGQGQLGRERQAGFQEYVLPILPAAHRCESTPCLP